MKNVIGRATLGLVLCSAAMGCNSPVTNKDGNLVLWESKVSVGQGEDVSVEIKQGSPDKIEGERDGVTAAITPWSVKVSVEKEAKLGTVELTLKDRSGTTASLTVTVTTPEPDNQMCSWKAAK